METWKWRWKCIWIHANILKLKQQVHMLRQQMIRMQLVSPVGNFEFSFILF